jgi:polyketide biosynthesis enoyl-CoA hydratase PksH
VDARSCGVTVRPGPGHVRACLSGSNVLTPAVMADLDLALDEAEHGEGCRAFVLAAEGESFCSGLDLADSELVKEWDDGDAAAYWRLLSRLRGSPLVTVALVDGAATGGGVGLAAACDFVIASPRARFRLTEVLLGLLPAMLLPSIARRVGETRAFRMALLAEEVDGVESVRIGLADTVADSPDTYLRRILAALGRTNAATVTELKTCRRVLFPDDSLYGQYAALMLGRRIADPFVQDRLESLRSGGLLK